MKINAQKINDVKKRIWEYYAKQKRELPWRNTTDPYEIFVSEVMLQQTQVSRVVKKYQEFLAVFPSWSRLSRASLGEVLRVWRGMGYNRRAKYLLEAAKTVVEKYNGTLPTKVEEIDALPGIGRATACSVAAFAFNQPTVFIETNIRRVYIHHFFQDKSEIDDKELLPLVKASLDQKKPREWYWALMDYGSHLGRTIGNANQKSKHYIRQSAFAPSDRRLRGIIVKEALRGPVTMLHLVNLTHESKERLLRILAALIKEGFLTQRNGRYQISS